MAQVRNETAKRWIIALLWRARPSRTPNQPTSRSDANPADRQCQSGNFNPTARDRFSHL